MKNFIKLLSLMAVVLLVSQACLNKDNKIKASCYDTVQNQDEIGVDCGGTICDPCPPSCSDGELNQNEEEIDCGGPNCPDCPDPCVNGLWDYPDEEWVDCGGDDCPPCEQCGNGAKDGGETGIDCDDDDLTDCPDCLDLCGDGLLNGNEIAIDCDDNDATISCPSCADLCGDGLLNGFEEEIDCGGPDCPVCPGCNDTIMNFDETGIDCDEDNFNDCPPCYSLCGDGILNGNEEKVDCGGPDCEECLSFIYNVDNTGDIEASQFGAEQQVIQGFNTLVLQGIEGTQLIQIILIEPVGGWAPGTFICDMANIGAGVGGIVRAYPNSTDNTLVASTEGINSPDGMAVVISAVNPISGGIVEGTFAGTISFDNITMNILTGSFSMIIQ